MRRSIFSLLILVAALALSFAALAQSGAPSNAAQPGPAKTQNEVPVKNLSGTWALRAPRGVPWYNFALIGEEPPMTPWAEEKFKANKPSFGPHPEEESNDPAYSCLPSGVPRVYAAVQAAMAATLGSGGPCERPCPGRSKASTFQPWNASQRLCSAHTV